MSVSINLGEVKEVALSQCTIRYRQGGAGQPIVFVHSDWANGDLWRKVVPVLSTDFRCITPDLPLGAHELTAINDTDLSPPGVTNLIAEFIAALDLERATLVGSNTGGVYCQLLVARGLEQIARLVLTDCHAYDNFPSRTKRVPVWLIARVPGALFIAAQVLFRVRVLHRLRLIRGFNNKKPIEPEIVDSYFRPAATISAVRRDLRKVWRSIEPHYTLEAAAKFGSFHCPVLIVWAEEDRIFPYSDATKLSEDFPNARLECIQDSYASVPEDQPERLAELIAAFMRETQEKAA